MSDSETSAPTRGERRLPMRQILRFAVVGVIVTVIDCGLLVALTEFAGLHYLLSSALSFSFSVLVNYLLSVAWVFDVPRDAGRVGALCPFVVLAAAGLLLNQALMWLGTDVLGMHYLLTKTGSTAVVMVYNFVSRKLLLERRP